MASQTIRGIHRSRELAERYRAQLARDNPFSEVRIVYRRDTLGRFSHRGKQYTFKITGEKQIENLEEFYEEYERAEEYETEDWESSADYHNE